MKTISSRNNPLVKLLMRLQSARDRHKLGQSVLEGIHLVQAYGAAYGAPVALAVSQSGAQKPEIKALLAQFKTIEPVLLDDAIFARCVSVATPTGVAAVVNTPISPLATPPIGACLMLEDIQDPGNLGTLLRSAVASGLNKVLLSPDCADAWAPRTLRAGQGAQFLLSVYEGVNLLEVAAAYTGRILAAVAQAELIYSDANLTGAVAFLIGNEGAGLSPALQSVAHETVSIPMAAGVESLNAAVAGSVLMFERQRQVYRGQTPGGV